MRKKAVLYLVFMLLSQTISNELEFEGGFVNGVQVGKCVAGFCLPFDYLKLEPPCMDCVNQISIETDIMDVLMVRKQQFSAVIMIICKNRKGFSIYNSNHVSFII